MDSISNSEPTSVSLTAVGSASAGSSSTAVSSTSSTLAFQEREIPDQEICPDQELDQIRRKYAASQMALCSLNLKYSQLLTEVETLKTIPGKLPAMELELSKAREQREEILRQNSDLEKRLSDLNKQHDSALSALKTTLAALKPENARLQTELHQARAEITTLRALVQQKESLLHDALTSVASRVGRKVVNAACFIPRLKNRLRG